MSAPLRILVADDETSARRRLVRFLQAHQEVHIVAECADGASARDAILSLKPDLVFLDVEMPELTGLQVIEQIGAENMPVTIFATAFDHYAIAAFDANAIDYLLKPFEQERLDRAMLKARTALCGEQRAAFRQRLASAINHASAAPQHLLIRVGENLQIVRLADIHYVSAEGNYVRLHTSDGEFQLRDTMVGIQKRLGHGNFRRIHRSHIVNLAFVSKLMPWFGGDYLVLMADGRRLTLSRTFRAVLADLA
jgi:two-component system LytT family response regulator